MVGANLEIMKRDSLRMRRGRPFVFSILKAGEGAERIASFIIEKGGLPDWSPRPPPRDRRIPALISISTAHGAGSECLAKPGASTV